MWHPETGKEALLETGKIRKVWNLVSTNINFWNLVSTNINFLVFADFFGGCCSSVHNSILPTSIKTYIENLELPPFLSRCSLCLRGLSFSRPQSCVLLSRPPSPVTCFEMLLNASRDLVCSF